MEHLRGEEKSWGLTQAEQVKVGEGEQAVGTGSQVPSTPGPAGFLLDSDVVAVWVGALGFTGIDFPDVLVSFLRIFDQELYAWSDSLFLSA